MHILMIHQNYTALNEAGGTRHAEVARHLVEAGHEVTVLTSPASYLSGQEEQDTGQERVDGVTVIRVRTYAAVHRSFLHRTMGFVSFMLAVLMPGLRMRGFDVVLGTSPPLFQALSAWLIARLRRIPFVFEVRDLWPIFAVEMGVLRNPALIKLAELVERWLYRSADLLIINSPGFRDHVLARGAKSDRLRVIPNGTDVSMFVTDECATNWRKTWGIDSQFVVLYAGAHGPANDLNVVLEAAEQLRERDDIHFVLLGDGKDKTNLQAWAQDHALSNVTFAPPVPKSQMASVLAAADAGLAILQPLPMFTTTYPNKVFDYMAASRPTILAIDGVIREVIEAADGGIFVPPGDVTALAAAVRAYANDPQRAQNEGENARHYVQAHFDRKQQARQLELALRTLAEPSRSEQ